ncbi:MAG: xanthine dehydrogenase accessory protein XdhC, partial [Leucothrix sp.]
VEAKGSVPRGAGTKMIVTDQGLHYGTIGGGNLEYQCIGVAKQRLSGADWQRKVQRFPLGASLGQCCGGVVIVLFEYIGTGQQVWLSDVLKHKAARQTVLLTTSLNHQTAAKQVALASAPSAVGLAEQTPDYLVETVKSNDFNIVVFGAGHVGRALVNVLAGLECEVTWVDSRAEEFPETIPANVIKAVEPNPEDVVETAPVDSYFVVLTHSHSLDQLLCERILTRSDFCYCGLIGSQSKRAKFEHRLRAKGFSEQQIATLTCPMGIPSLGGKQPGHIAVAVAAQLLEQQASY